MIDVRSVLAHVGRPPAPHDLPVAWTFDPLVVAGLTVAAWLYVRGLRRLWQSAGVGQVVSRGRSVAFAGGLTIVFLALISPVDAAGNALFVAHMIQHLLLALVAAPLLAIAAPTQPMVWALKPRDRRRAGRWQGRLRRLSRRHEVALLGAGFTVYVLSWWIWHAPALYELAVTNDLVHAVQHASLLGGGLAFWWPVLRPKRLPPWVGLIAMFAAAAQSALLAALLTFTARPWYAVYQNRTSAWGISPLQDQQLGGVVMWILAATVYLLLAATFVVRWLGDDERAADRLDGRLAASRTVSGGDGQ